MKKGWVDETFSRSQRPSYVSPTAFAALIYCVINEVFIGASYVERVATT